MSNPQSATLVEGFKLNYVTGNLATSAPDNAVLIHSCNCVGKWGTGVATALAKKFPKLAETCQEYCKDHSIEELLGTCVMAWAEDEDVSRTQWVACLFTSKGYGKKTPHHPGKSSPAAITAHTRTALQDLRQQLEDYKDSTPPPGEKHPDVSQLWACKFNSGFFGVEWAVTEQVLLEVFSGWNGEMKIVSPE